MNWSDQLHEYYFFIELCTELSVQIDLVKPKSFFIVTQSKVSLGLRSTSSNITIHYYHVTLLD